MVTILENEPNKKRKVVLVVEKTEEDISSSYIEKLPFDVKFRILTKLPVEILIQLLRYSNSLINHPQFLNYHLSSVSQTLPHLLLHQKDHYFIPRMYSLSFHDPHNFYSYKYINFHPLLTKYDSVKLVGSNRGLLFCLVDAFDRYGGVSDMILWNPLISEYKYIKGDTPAPSEYCNQVVGFGFDHVRLDFKVIQILYFDDVEFEFPVQAFVYGVKNGSWRRIHQAVPCFVRSLDSNYVSVDCFVYWLGYKQQRDNSAGPDCLLRFDLVKEVFKCVDLPQDLLMHAQNMTLTTSHDGKFVALLVSYHHNNNNRWSSVWVMNDNDKADQLWEKKYELDYNQLNHLKRILVCKGQISKVGPIPMVDDQASSSLQLCDDHPKNTETENDGGTLDEFEDILVSFDLGKNKMEYLAACISDSRLRISGYTPSLALLDIEELLKQNIPTTLRMQKLGLSPLKWTENYFEDFFEDPWKYIHRD